MCTVHHGGTATDVEQDDREAVVAMFQNNVVGKIFTVTHDLLVDLELFKADASAIDQAVRHWNDCLGVWVKACEGSIIDLTRSKIGNNAFFKTANITRYHGLQELLKTVSPRCVQNLRNNLPAAQASVRDAKLRRLIQTSSSTPPSTHLQPARSLPPTVKTVYLKPHYTSQAIGEAIELSSDDDPPIWAKTGKGKREHPQSMTELSLTFPTVKMTGSLKRSIEMFSR